MSFGPHYFESGPEWSGLMRRFLLCYLAPIVVMMAFAIAAMLGVAALPSDPQALAHPPIGTFAIIGLAIAIPLGLVGGFVRYRNWRFFIRHLEATGEIDLATLTQSRTPEPRQGEGLLDALDMGGF